MPEPGVSSNICRMVRNIWQEGEEHPQDAPAPGNKWACLGCLCHLREAVLERLTCRCLAWLAGMVFPSTLPGAAGRQRNGLAQPAKLNTAGDVPVAPPEHSIPGVGAWASLPPHGPASSPKTWCGRNDQPLSGSGSAGASSPGLSLQSSEARSGVFRPYCSLSKAPVASPVPMPCSVSWGNWERRVSVSAARLHK